jgi:hypothetical protein
MTFADCGVYHGILRAHEAAEAASALGNAEWLPFDGGALRAAMGWLLHCWTLSPAADSKSLRSAVRPGGIGSARDAGGHAGKTACAHQAQDATL